MCIDLRVSAEPSLTGGLPGDAKRRGDDRPGDADRHQPIDLSIDGVLRSPKVLDKNYERRRQPAARNPHRSGVRLPPMRRRSESQACR